MRSLESLYVQTAASPIPRPLLAHLPHKTAEDFQKAQALGHISEVRPKFQGSGCLSAKVCQTDVI